MSHRLHIEMDTAEGALLRVLGTIERRGFAVMELIAGRPRPDRQALDLDLQGDRDPVVLCRQLERLVDVRSVRLEATPVARPTPAATVAPEREPELAFAGGFHASWLD